ncbi:outer membrane lipoprotein-sorting protein [Desulfocicer vacuolatum DSM 3385]|uniref:Outer membrane lipoprotein-sorting protein n=1 Tax=Desulfocicer vacuolatum DSM 3385 TaxID=1121400 RepID=A0A1W2CZ90_9BACT|nr:outer membrane lipoprotein-sorting protein [Desulfocicer vacuolatum]SMC90162.1 outer membrane lipoprotein-sorting protein [Desulfocicer vacuolatum DSM 3385]
MKWISSKKTGIILFIFIVFFNTNSFSTEKNGHTMDLSIQKILEKADKARGNRDGISWEVSILSSENKKKSKMAFNVSARGFDTLAESIAPAKDKGNKILMVNGNMWFYKPGLNKAVPISQRQKLIGNAAYGDIAATNYAEDYEATPMPDDIVNQEVCHVFLLKAKTKNATYDHIHYWISRDSGLGIKSIYFTVSGKKLKSAEMKYDNFVEIDGKSQPFISKIIIRDILIKQNMTTLLFENAQIKDIPNHIFNRNLLKK